MDDLLPTIWLLHLQFSYESLKKVQVRGDRTQRQTVSFSPIRITPVFMEPIDGRFQDQLTNSNGPLTRVVNFLENTLGVRPIQGNLTIPPTCDEYTHGLNEGKCRVLHTVTGCGILDVPRRFIGTQEVCSTSSSKCSVSGPNGAGAAHTDFLLFIGTISTCRSWNCLSTEQNWRFKWYLSVCQFTSYWVVCMILNRTEWLNMLYIHTTDMYIIVFFFRSYCMHF